MDSRPRAAAQDKARQSADAICKVVADWVPIAYGAFEDYRMGAVTPDMLADRSYGGRMRA